METTAAKHATWIAQIENTVRWAKAMYRKRGVSTNAAGSRCSRQPRKNHRTSSRQGWQTARWHNAVRMVFFGFLALVSSLSPSSQTLCAERAVADQPKRLINETRMDDKRHSEVTTLLPEKVATERPDATDNRSETFH